MTVLPQQPFTPDVEDQGLSGTIATLPAATVAKVAGVPGVGAAHGQISVQNLTLVDSANHPVGPTNGAPTLGQNWYDTHQFTITRGRPPAAAGTAASSRYP